MAHPSRFRRTLYAALPSLLVVLLVASAYRCWSSEEQTHRRGQRINREAWERSYTERGLPVPESGPRTGYWGARMEPRVEAPGVSWHEHPIRIDGLLEIDADGFQHYRSAAPRPARVLILGGSVALGSYASRIETSYFHRLGRALEAAGAPSDLHVLAGGAWKASQEVRGLERHLARLAPDVVVLFDGLNDLTVGGRSDALFGERVETPEGIDWHPLYHARDYPRRVRDYLGWIREASALAQAQGSPLVVVLQPSLAERAEPSAIERELLAGSVPWYGPVRVLRESYQAMREGLRELEREGALTFVDASRAFEGESATVFADLWHYGDAGHRIVAERMAGPIASLLRADGAARARTSGP